MQQVIDNMVRAGASQQDLDAYVATSNDSLFNQAVAWGMTEEEAAAYVDRIGAIPPAVATVVDLEADAAYEDLEKLIQSIETSDGYITIDARNDPAVARLVESLGLVNDGTGIFTIDANSDPATVELLASLGVVDTSTGTITIDGNNKESMDALGKAVDAVNKGKGTVSILGKDKTAPVLSETKNRINNSAGTIKIYGSDYASGTADSIVRNINGKSAYIKIHGVRVAQGLGGGGGMTIADGGVISYYAQGGVENHVAQIAPAGAWRVWAEPETGGEAYIPYAMSKRARSLAILEQVANDFGHVLLDQRAFQSRADGGLPGGLPGGPRSTSAQMGAGVVNNFYDYSTTYYPVAEPKSIKKGRELQQVGANVGGLG